MQQSDRLDNSQAIRDLGWLAGILDGEGSIILGTFQRKEGFKQTYHRVCFYNSDEGVINKVSKILDANNVGNHISSRLQYGNLGSREGFTVQVSNLQSIKKLLELILSDLTCKKDRAELMMRFCDSRLKHKSKPLDDVELGLLNSWDMSLKTKS
jgi:hypothetical protein